MAKNKRKERLLEPLKPNEVINIAHKIRLEPKFIAMETLNVKATKEIDSAYVYGDFEEVEQNLEN